MSETEMTRKDSGENRDDNVDKGSIDKSTRGSVSSEISSFQIETESLLCGWLSLRPKCLQPCATSNWLTAVLGTLMFIQGFAISGILYMSLSSIEIRFGFSSTAIGIIAATYDVTIMVLIGFVSYFGATRNKPNILGFGAVIMGCGSLMWAVPHFTSGLYDYDAAYGDEDTLCVPGRNTSKIIHDCIEEGGEGDLSYYFFVFLFAQILHGIGASPIYTVGYAFSDENASHRKASWYLGILSALSIFGPTIGYLVGAYFLTIYVDPLHQDDVTIDNTDPGWVGAWWIGFVLSWILAWLIAIPIGAFPPELPGTKDIQNERQSQAHHSDDAELVQANTDFGKGWNDLWPSTKMLLKNPYYCFMTISKTALTFVIVGFLPFILKFIENQFGLTSSQAGLILAVTSIPGAAGGTLLGGWIINKFNWKVVGMTRFYLGASLITTCLYPVFYLQCPEQQVAGVITSYNSSDTSDLDVINLNHPCNSVCGCAGTETYDPVCGTNNLLYFDACYAGCLDTPDDGETYYNCSCIFSENESGDSPEAVSGKCTYDDCWQLPVFIVGFFFILLTMFLLIAPRAIPGPIVMGIVVDSACVMWQEDCGDTGTCWIYDNHGFAMRFVVFGAAFTGLAMLCSLGALLTYKPPPEPSNEEKIDSANTEPISTIGNSTTTLDKQKERSTVSLLGYTKTDPSNEISGTILENKI
ncbi:solute carrier organic anion transporter family member 4C1-like [Saccoglossus kowalevskii]|uniref:Solute carrier organic anion transporter family member n=1 Tax=Saccoglossus kowalevskii TaxID=10224 RepID=A0ABM0LVX7_SACKO|nr:PREDICTED: solute carrier organic anion transporter family member 4C1-like [Saccoglossus kowalevskii]